MAVVKVTKNSAAHLKAIHAFIAKRSFQNAGSVIVAIRAEIKKLAFYPEIGHIVKEIDSDNFREIKIYKYRIIYYTEVDTVYILTIHHSAMLLINNPHLKDLL